MLARLCRRRQSPPFSHSLLLPRPSQARCYTQQRTARTPRSAPQASTTNPSPGAQRKNRVLPSTTAAPPAPGARTGASVKSRPPIPGAAAEDTKAFVQVRRAAAAREMEQSGEQIDRLRMSIKAGMEPWASKAFLLDLRIPSKETSVKALRDNFKNNVQNILRCAAELPSMFRLANDFAFPGIVTKWRIHPQLFRAKSTSDGAWVAPFRHDLLDIYTRINRAIAAGDPKPITKFTAYEYQQHAMQLLHRSARSTAGTGRTHSWELQKLLAPVQILSLRAYPLYHAPEEPRYGNRLCAQALVRFETLQTLTVRNARGQVIRPDGTVAEEGYAPEPRRVLEYLVCENKMFYQDGWYIRDQMFEGVKPNYKDV
ncbi:hypothetical protein DFH11DRAFT_1509836 [Phellopilus nigrolimitatus]|nr:hypothetical protein DFH11DRAFT_1509836 [Phellopilus nigrolimitatus]